ncbi:MAG: methyl-accepting chemotaxis protein [Acidobacteriota bacterium]
MPKTLWNMIARVGSAFAAVLLVLGGTLILLWTAGTTKNLEAGIATILIGSLLALVSLAATNYSCIKFERESHKAADIAHQLSQGRIFSDDPDLGYLKEVSDYLARYSAIVDQIANDGMPEHVTPLSDSDALGRSVRDLVERLVPRHQTQQGRDVLQVSVNSLLKDVSEIAAGDLTIKAKDTNHSTRAIALAINSMTENLRSLIRQIKDVVYQVGSSTGTMNETTEQLARGSVAQASQITRTTSALAGTAAGIQTVANDAERSAGVAASCLQNSKLGAKAATDNIAAMNSVRKQVQETAKRVKRLGERAQEIGQIVTLIEDLSDKTGLLALNASLQSASNDTMTAGFSVVAEEVERLAERSNRLTRQIAGLTQAINIETNEVVVSMDETIHEVIVGSTLANKAGQYLLEIENVSDQLANSLRWVADSATQQARNSNDIFQAMNGISEVTEIVRLGAKHASESVGLLVRLSAELCDSVSPFKLPPAGISAKTPTEPGLFIN